MAPGLQEVKVKTPSVLRALVTDAVLCVQVVVYKGVVYQWSGVPTNGLVLFLGVCPCLGPIQMVSTCDAGTSCTSFTEYIYVIIGS